LSHTDDNPADALAAEFRRCVAAGDIDAASAIQQELWRSDPPFAPRTIDDIPILPWKRDYAAAEHEQFLFVSGAPRSGTTALGRLLHTHLLVSLYVELFSFRFGYVPEMFNRANIIRLNRDGLLKSFDKHRNPDVLSSVTPEHIVGDKRPNFMTSAALSLRNFAGKAVTIVHIVRPIRQVAMSYLTHVNSGRWHASRDHRLAVEHLNRNNRNALDLVERVQPGHRVVVIDYNSFWSAASNAERLFGEIGLDAEGVSKEDVAAIFRISERVPDRSDALPTEASGYIDAHYDFDAEARLRALAFA